MPEFIPRPRESGLAALIAQMQATQMDPIAQGITQAGQSIGNAFAGIGQAKRADATRRNEILEKLAASGNLEMLTGTVVNGQKVWDQPSGGSVPLRDLFGDQGFPQGVSYKQKKTGSDKIEVTPELAKQYPGLQVGSVIPSTFLAEYEQKKIKKKTDDQADAAKPKVVEFEGVKFLEKPGKNGPTYLSMPNQKGSAEAVQNVADAIQSFGKIDEYFTSVEGAGKTEIGKRFATSNLPGSEMLNPKVAQSEAALLNLFQFANGGKALTDTEQRIIKGIAKNPAYGKPERAKAKQDLKDLLYRRINATLESNATGDAKGYLKSELEKALRGSNDGDVITIIASDGSEHQIFKKNLDAAKKRDPKLKVKGA